MVWTGQVTLETCGLWQASIVDPRELAKLMAEAAIEFNDQPDQSGTVDSVLRLARDLVPGTAHASLTVLGRRGVLRTLAETGPMAREADQVQYSLREGPCVDLIQYGGDWIRSGNVGADPRWPSWGPQASELGVSALLSVELRARGKRTGTVNFYSTERDSFSTTAAIDAGVVLGVHAGHALYAAGQIEGLANAMKSRHQIGLAQGILMERYSIGVDRSFELLRRISSHHNLKISELARQIVSTGKVPQD